MGLEVKGPAKVEEVEILEDVEKGKEFGKGDFITVPVGLSRGGPGDTVIETAQKPYGTV